MRKNNIGKRVRFSVPSLYFGMLFGLTFPSGIVLGIPLYVSVGFGLLA